jgi:hypothetical protein
MQFETAVQALCDAGVEFVIIGGVAAVLHGSATVTYDLDICYSRDTANLERLAAALAPFNPRPREFPGELPFLWDAATLRNISILTLQTSIGEIDLISEVPGLGAFASVRPHCIRLEAFGREIETLDLRTLIRSKRAAGRPRDLSAVAELESLLEASEQ